MPDSDRSTQTRPVRLRVHRVPRVWPIIGTAAAIGLVSGVLIDLLGPTTSGVTASSSTAFFAVTGMFVGALLGAVLVALLTKRR